MSTAIHSELPSATTHESAIPVPEESEDEAIIDRDAPLLCSECKSIFDHWYDRDAWSSARPVHSHHNIFSLRESSQNGCSVCALLLHGFSDNAVEHLLRNWPDLKGLVTVAKSLPGTGDGYEITLKFHPDPDDSEIEGPLEVIIDAFRSGK